jgi:hypothetical protein
MQTHHGAGQSLVVAGEPAEPHGPCEALLDDPALGQQDEAARRVDRRSGLLTRVPVVGIQHFHRLSGHLRHRLGQCPCLRSCIFIGGGAANAKSVPMVSTPRGTFDPCGSLCPSVPARRLHSSVERRARLSPAAALGSGGRPEAACTNRRRSWIIASKTPDPRTAARLLIQRFPRQKVGRQPAPGHACPHDIAHRVEHLAPLVSSLGRGLRQQAQIGRDKGPFVVTHATGIRTSFHAPISCDPAGWFITLSSIHDD